PAARSARASAARAALVRRRRIAIPATTSSWAVLDAGGKGVGSSRASARSASSRRPIRRSRRTSRYRAWAAFTRSPSSSGGARAAASPRGGPPRAGGAGADPPRGDAARGGGHRLSRAKRTGGSPQESLGANEIAELRHRDASQRESRRVVAEGDPLQGAE